MATKLSEQEKLELFQKLLDERNEARWALQRLEHRIKCIVTAEDLHKQFGDNIPEDVLAVQPSRVLSHLRLQGYIPSPI